MAYYIDFQLINSIFSEGSKRYKYCKCIGIMSRSTASWPFPS